MKRIRIGAQVALALGLHQGASFYIGGNAVEAQYAPSAVFDHYAVAADHSDGAAAGAAMLALGGNAADAAVAAMLALGVVHPASSGLGGGGYALVYDAKSGQVAAIDFRETAPASAYPEMFVNAPHAADLGPLSAASEYGGKAVAIPGEPAGLALVHTRFGRLDRGIVTAPALHLAEDGFIVSDHLAMLSEIFGPQLTRDEDSAQWFPDGATALVSGAKLRRLELAETLRRFAARADRDFYRGPIAKALLRRINAAGGKVTLADFRGYAARVRPPVQSAHFNYRWVSAPPPSAGGVILLQTIGLLEHWLNPGQPVRDDVLVHGFIEAFKGPFWDRQRFIGDPDFVNVPIDQLLSPRRTAFRAARFHPLLAQSSADYAAPIVGYRDPLARTPEGDGTANVCVVDSQGNAVAMTSTVNLPFGARIGARGVLLNNEMDDFSVPTQAQRQTETGANTSNNAEGLSPSVQPRKQQPGGAQLSAQQAAAKRAAEPAQIDNLPRPGQRPLSTLAPTLVFDAQGLALCIGASSGGTRIVSAVAQVALKTLVGGVDPRLAVSAARIHHQGPGDDLVRTELLQPLSPDVEASLVARGHRIDPINYAAAVQLVRVVHQRGETQLVAVTDPRKPAAPAGR